MKVIRAFIAIELPHDIQQCLGKVSTELKQQAKDAPVRWVAPENIHLTIKFLGDVSVNNIEVLKDMLLAETLKQEPFEISMGGLGAFPNTRHPRVIWVGVEAPEELYSLQRAIEMQSIRLGYSPDKRPFSAHLTLGRVARHASPAQVRIISKVINNYHLGFLGVARVDHIALFKSDLKPTGPIYSRLFEAPFKG